MSNFRKVARQKVKASIMIEGLQGTGKSGLALALARVLADDWSKVYAIDTENQSLDLFDKLKLHNGDVVSDFNKVDLTSDDGFAPSSYMKLREAAINEGAEVVVMDSISHMWNRKGGLLDKVTEAQASGLDNYRSWGTDEIRKEKELIFDLVRSHKAHIITTVRDKEKFGMEFDETKNRNKVISLGEQQVQQEGLKYEPDLVLRMKSAGHTDGTAPVAEVLKSRYAILRAGEEYEFTETLLQSIRQYLEEGIDPEILVEQQKTELVDAIKSYCNTPARKSIWKALKESSGFTGKLEDMPLDLMKRLYKRLITD